MLTRKCELILVSIHETLQAQVSHKFKQVLKSSCKYKVFYLNIWCRPQTDRLSAVQEKGWNWINTKI